MDRPHWRQWLRRLGSPAGSAGTRPPRNSARLPSEKLARQPNLTAVKVDVLNEAILAEQIRDHEAVLSAFSGRAQDDILGYYLRGIRSIIAAVKKAGELRLLVVGGAGALEVAPDVLLLDTPEFPAQWKATAEGARPAWQMLRQETELDWKQQVAFTTLGQGLCTTPVHYQCVR